jgi:hypothetical protein
MRIETLASCHEDGNRAVQEIEIDFGGIGDQSNVSALGSESLD